MTGRDSGPDALLAGRVALVTGSGRGIGAAVARLLGAHGAAVGVNVRSSTDDAAGVVADIVAAAGRAVVVRGDVVTRGARLVAETARLLGPVDTLVLNASGHDGYRPGPLAEQDPGEVARCAADQLHAVLEPVRAAVPGMVDRGGGCVIVIGSGMSRQPAAGFGPLAVAKAAADATVRSLALELGPRGVRVNVVAPGFVETATSSRFVPPQARQALAAGTPLRRCATPEDVAGVVLLAASDHSGFVTGQYLTVSGGAF